MKAIKINVLLSTLVFSLSLLVILAGCSSDDDNPTGPVGPGPGSTTTTVTAANGGSVSYGNGSVNIPLKNARGVWFACGIVRAVRSPGPKDSPMLLILSVVLDVEFVRRYVNLMQSRLNNPPISKESASQ